MKKLLTLTTLLLLVGCGNQNTLGFGNYTYNYLNCNDNYGGFSNEPISSWKDFEGEQIEITLENGNNLLISLNNCYLSKNKVD